MNIEDLTEELIRELKDLDLVEQVEALNRVRRKLHESGPFFAEPVDLVVWKRGDRVRANDYNPNSVAPPEMQLLQHSIELDHFTQPIVTMADGDENEVVDGFHRNRVGREVNKIRERMHGYLPITELNADRCDRADRMAATIRHNRARGKHDVGRMSEIVREMYERGLSDRQITNELGMEIDEVVRLKQITGLAALFKSRKFSEAWEPHGEIVDEFGEKVPSV